MALWRTKEAFSAGEGQTMSEMSLTFSFCRSDTESGRDENAKMMSMSKMPMERRLKELISISNRACVIYESLDIGK